MLIVLYARVISSAHEGFGFRRGGKFVADPNWGCRIRTICVLALCMSLLCVGLCYICMMVYSVDAFLQITDNFCSCILHFASIYSVIGITMLILTDFGMFTEAK